MTRVDLRETLHQCKGRIWENNRNARKGNLELYKYVKVAILQLFKNNRF